MALAGEAKREYQRQWRAKRRAAWFAGKACVRCGSDEDLELDHVDPTLKVTNAVWSWSQERRDVELAKCQVLCNACHKAKTISQTVITIGLKAYRHGTCSMYEHHRCRCGLCRLWARNKKRRQRAA
ncbi:HNH endonuclease [Mycobacterium phage Bricole]|uniref:HNH endonuclease n=1 Tax=Mycobacterium phage Bricole TaxID=1718601 RepID=A0A0M4RQY5_9CAUD|nr:HNH endonuclease [Mycobacterium phage Bricole]